MAFSGPYVCDNFRQDLLALWIASKTIKTALFNSSATLTNTITAYATTNEITGTGYTAAGVTMAGGTTSRTGAVAWIDWTTDPQWTSASFTARGALTYNSTNNTAMWVLDFGVDKTVIAGTFKIVLPTADATHAIFRLG